MNTNGTLILLSGAAVFILLVAFKTYHFYKTTQRPTFKKWLAFSKVEIEGSANIDKKKQKKLQNYYTLALLLFITFFLLFLWLAQNA